MIRAAVSVIGRAKVAILSVGATYVISIVIGAAMVHVGQPFALEQRDAIVAAAASGAILASHRAGDRPRAALLDFGANLVAGASSTLTGLAVVGPYPIAAHRGWVGGIVSVDAQHRSRLAEMRSAAYYLGVVALQIIPYSIAGGVGVQVGLIAWRRMRDPGPKWLGVPVDALRDAAISYLVIAPLFLVASLVEFFAR